MKKMLYILCCTAVVAICCVSVFSETDTDRQWTIKGYPRGYWSDYMRVPDKVRVVELSELPAFLQTIYENDRFYKSKILSYNKDIQKSFLIEVEKTPYKKGLSLRYEYCGDSLLSLIEQRLDAVCKKLPVVKRGVLHERYECCMYDASEYADKVLNNPYLTVVKDHGRIIWCVNAESIGDVAQLYDGRYFVVTEQSAYYVTVTDDRIIGEVYFGNRRVAASNQYVDRSRLPVSVTILTDNVIRQEYEDGSIEHWKIRLSEEDVDKNTEKRREVYENEGRSVPIEAGDKCLLWWNGKGKGSLTRNNQKMWCYHEGGPEPTADSYSEMSLAKTVSDRGAAVKSAAAATDHPEKGKTSAATGWFGSLVARIKGFFAGLFS